MVNLGKSIRKMDSRAVMHAPNGAEVKTGMRKKMKRNRQKTNSTAKRLKHLEVSLDGATIKMALNLGDGDLSLGIRRAVVSCQ